MPDGDLVIIVTQSEPETAMCDYKERWQIETLFGCLKTRGFNFEATHMTNPERIDRLMGYLAIAFAWAHIVGEWLNEQRPIRIKKHGRPAQSIFAYGLGHLRFCLLGIHQSFKREAFREAVEQLQQRLSQDKQCLAAYEIVLYKDSISIWFGESTRHCSRPGRPHDRVRKGRQPH